MKKQTKLELIYLMNVALYLPTIEDIKTFETINKKSSTVLHSLKVNPWMNSSYDINKFCSIFCPSTCNCNGLNIHFDVLQQSIKIRNLSVLLTTDGIVKLFNETEENEMKCSEESLST